MKSKVAFLGTQYKAKPPWEAGGFDLTSLLGTFPIAQEFLAVIIGLSP
jgi:hypothetical protein